MPARRARVAHQLVARIGNERRPGIGEQCNRFGAHAFHQPGADLLVAMVVIGQHRRLGAGMAEELRAHPCVFHGDQIHVAQDFRGAGR